MMWKLKIPYNQYTHTQGYMLKFAIDGREIS